MSLLRRSAQHNRFVSGWATASGNPWFIPTNGQVGSMMGGQVMVTPESAMQVAAVYACVRLLAGVVSGLELVAVGPDGKALDDQPDIVTNPFGGEDNTDPLLPTRREGFRQFMVALLLRGNSYASHVSLGQDGKPTMVQILNPDAVSVSWTDKGLDIKVNGETISDPRTISICRGLAQPGSLTGMSPISYARRTIALAMASEEFGAAFFDRGVAPSGIVEVEGDLSKEQASQIKATFEESHAGLQNAHAVGILSGGAKFTPLTITAEDAQFLGTQSAKTLDIAMLYGIPPHMLGQVDRTTSWGKGIEEQTRGFTNFTLKFWTDIIEDFWSSFLPHGVRARFIFDELTRPDMTTRYAAWMVARNASILSINEIRAREGLDPIEGGEDLFAPLNSAHTTVPGWTPEGDEGDPEKLTTPSGEQPDEPPTK